MEHLGHEPVSSGTFLYIIVPLINVTLGISDSLVPWTRERALQVMSSHIVDLGQITSTGCISFCDIGINFDLGAFFSFGIKFKTTANSSSFMVSGVILLSPVVYCNKSEDVNNVSSACCFSVHS